MAPREFKINLTVKPLIKIVNIFVILFFYQLEIDGSNISTHVLCGFPLLSNEIKDVKIRGRW